MNSVNIPKCELKLSRKSRPVLSADACETRQAGFADDKAAKEGGRRMDSTTSVAGVAKPDTDTAGLRQSGCDGDLEITKRGEELLQTLDDIFASLDGSTETAIEAMAS